MNKTLSDKQKPHSRLGIASFVLSLLSPLLLIAGITFLSTNGPLSLIPVLVSLVLMVLVLPLALLLGVIALLQKTSRKDFALAGIIISAVFILLLLGFLTMLLKDFRVPGI